MTTDTLDLPIITGIDPAATAVAPVSTTSEVIGDLPSEDKQTNKQ